MSDKFRCSAASLALDEPLAGTASKVRAFLLLEDPGPWGVDALPDSRLPADVVEELLRSCRRHGVRPLLIRRHGRSVSSGRCFAAYVDVAQPRLEGGKLTRTEDVLDLDLEALTHGGSTGLQPERDPLFLVCTHGRHDACCAERGRPLAAALSRSHPEQTWECSHIGGDRFAANLVVLPDGLYYGRVVPEVGRRIVRAHAEGSVDLDHLRGRAGVDFAVQAAEWHLRRQMQLTGVSQVVLDGSSTTDEITDAVFTVDRRERWQVRVRCTADAAQQLTCRSERLRHPLQTELVGIQPMRHSPKSP